MKKVLLIVLLVLIGLVIIGKMVGQKDNGETGNQASANGNRAALELIKQEPKVKEALITDANVLYVSVVDDGTNRDGYASYLCEILREKRAAAKRVKVVKVNSTTDPERDNSYGVLLGESNCN